MLPAPILEIQSGIVRQGLHAVLDRIHCLLRVPRPIHLLPNLWVSPLIDPFGEEKQIKRRLIINW